MASIEQQLLSLQAKPIDPSKCTPNKSLYWQIMKNNQTALNRQTKQFNLGNTGTFNDPIKAAQFLLQREYGESSLFKEDDHEAIFIPPTFVSNQYTKESPVAILDYKVKKDIDRLLKNLKENSPEHWLTKELQTFMQTQIGIGGIDRKVFDQWVLNLKIMYLVIQELKTDKVSLPSIISDLGVFVQACIKEIQSKSPESALKTFLQESLGKKDFKKLLKRKIEENPPQDSNLRWLFELELSELGEKLEHWFYDQLLPLKDDILQDTAVLSSANFLTNFKNKKHKKETDFLIFSWQRKLIISVEMKRQLTNNRAFEQLASNHQLFEERLGDQLGPGWTFFPVVCVENSTITFESQNYITMETEIKSWLSSIFAKFPIVQIVQKPTPLDQLNKVLRIIVFSIHVSKKDLIAPITSSNWVEYIQNAIDNVSTSDNILFYSRQQMAVMNSNDARHNKLIIRGPFGVGKSILLQQKAIQLNNQPEYNGKVMYVLGDGLFYSDLSSMLYHRLKIDLEENHGITVVEIDSSETEQEQILQKIVQDDIKAVICDEFDMNDYKDFINKMMNMNHVDFMWIVPGTLDLKNNKFEKWENDFTFLDLSQNFRNSREIVKTIKSVAEKSDYKYKKGIFMPPDNFPSGCTPILVDSLEDAMKEARKLTKNGILVISCEKVDSNAGIAVTLNQTKENWKIYRRDNGNDFKKEENPYKFLQEGNVLIIDDDISFGFEWPTVIVVEGTHQSTTLHDCNFMIRCTTNLIVVKK